MKESKLCALFFYVYEENIKLFIVIKSIESIP